MAQIINTNIASLNAQRNLNQSGDSLRTSLERLSTGLRINSAKDDAAGLAISERFSAQIRGIDQAVRNANDGISFAQTAEGALGTVGDSLQRIRELAVQSANDTNSTSDRQALNDEVQQLLAEVNRVSTSTQFNGQNILDGTSSELVFQVGANQGQTITVSGVDARASQLGAELGAGDSVVQSDINTAGISAGDLTDISLNGVSIDLSNAESLDDVVQQINVNAGDSNVEASRAGTVTTDALTFTNTVDSGAGDQGELTLNGVTVTFDSTQTTSGLVDDINAVSEQTGVSAELSGGDIVLSSNGDIDVSSAVTGSGSFSLGTVDQTNAESFQRGIELTTDVGGSITVAGTDAAALGLDSVTTESRTAAAVSVATRDDASEALQTIDFALNQVNSLRAELGAVQTRFESTISNLSISSENLSAARSRIRDADFAQETSNLAKAQILQQAGTSVLTQANALPQNVLALLQ